MDSAVNGFIMLSICVDPLNHAPPASAAAYNLGPLMPAAQSVSVMDGVRFSAMLLFLFLVASSLGGAFAVRDFRRMNPVVPAVLSRNGAVLLPKRMPVPPSGPSRRHN